MLAELAPGLWTTTKELRFPGNVRLPARMTVVRLPSGGLLLHSPIAPDDELAAEVAALGDVEALVAPSCWHHRFVGPWHERYPAARMHGSRGLASKRPDLHFTGILGDDAPPAWQSVLEELVIEGAPKLNEVVFLHRPSRTLIVSDLLFHVLAPATLGTRIALTLAGTRGRLAMSRAWRLFTNDRAALRTSVGRVLDWDFTRILPGHGTPLEAEDAHAQARAALAWALHRA